MTRSQKHLTIAIADRAIQNGFDASVGWLVLHGLRPRRLPGQDGLVALGVAGVVMDGSRTVRTSRS